MGSLDDLIFECTMKILNCLEHLEAEILKSFEYFKSLGYQLL